LDDAAAAADAGIVDEEVDLVGVELATHRLGPGEDLFLDRNIGDVSDDARALRRVLQRAALGFGHVRA